MSFLFSGGLFDVIPDSVVSRFNFEQNLQDAVNSFDATHSAGSPSYSTNSQEGSYSLDKSASDYVTIPYDIDETSFSLIGWVYFRSDGEWLDSRDGSYQGAGRVVLSGGTLNAKSDDWNSGEELTASINQNTWYHVVYQYESGNAELYVNNNLIDSSSPSDPQNGRPDVYIGSSGGQIEGGASVLTDDVIVANGRLSSQEVSYIYG